MTRYALAFVLAVAAFAVDSTPAQDEKKEDKAAASATSPVSVKLSLDSKTDSTIPVRYAFTITLRSYCIHNGFNSKFPPILYPPPPPVHRRHSKRIICNADSPEYEHVNVKADDIIAAFGKDTQYTIQKGDDTHLLFFCAAKACSGEGAIRAAVAALSKTLSPRYFEDITVPKGVDPSALAGAVPNLSSGSVSARVLPDGKCVRLETDGEIDSPTLADLKTKLTTTPNDELKAVGPFIPGVIAARIELPKFCLSGNLTDPPKQADTPCLAPQRLATTANAADIATALSGDKMKVTADSASSLIVACGAAKCDGKALQMLGASAEAMAKPKPSYVEEREVLTHTASSAIPHISEWSGGAITADFVSDDRIRLKSDLPVESSDLRALADRLKDAGFGPPTGPPLNRMFYSDAGAVVGRLDTIPAPPTPGTSTPAPNAHPPSTYGTGMTAVGDSVVLTDNQHVTDGQRIRLLTLLDIPRPEVLMNLWSLQESNPNGKELSSNAALIRNTVAIHNEALQNAIEYGWAYLSREMHKEGFFDDGFKNYITQRFVADAPYCTDPSNSGTGCVSASERDRWKFCPANQYCLGYTDAFEPIKPTLTNILLGLMAAKDPIKTVFTTLGCMEGKFEVYSTTCFQDREAIKMLPALTESDPKVAPKSDDDIKKCLMDHRTSYLKSHSKGKNQPSCEDLDRAALDAQRQCKVTTALPLACFTIQAAQSFVPFHGFTTFTTRQLDELAEADISDNLEGVSVNDLEAFNALQATDKKVKTFKPYMSDFSANPLGLLRAATANFLFHYKMAQQFPNEFSPYLLTQSAQGLNALFNPLITAFNQDVSAFSEDLRQGLENKISQGHWFTPWDPHNKSFLADGSLTVRGISGVESLVDTTTMSAFNSPQYQTLPDVLNNLATLANGTTSSASANGSSTTTSTSVTSGDTTTTTATTAPTTTTTPPLNSNLLALLPGGLAKASLPVALAAAISPTPATAVIGRQLNLHVTPHTLPGASSAELDVNLVAQEDEPPALYSDHGATSNTDPVSRVAKHSVVSRVRVESVKLFEVSSFSALIERPRTNFPLLPLPFIEVPVIGDLLSLPWPGAKVYHRSTAVISAVIVPTAADLAYGLEFHADRAVVEKSNIERSFMKITSQSQLPIKLRRLYPFNDAVTKCFAKSVTTDVPPPPRTHPASSDSTNVEPQAQQPEKSCATVTLADVPPDR